MFSFNKMSTPTLALLLMATLLPATSFAKEAPKGATNEQAKEQSKEQAKDQAKPAGDQTVLRVNGTAITRLDVNRAIKVMLAQNQVQEPLPAETMKEAEEATLEQLTAAELLYQQASKLEIKDLDKQIAEKVAQNRAKFKSDAEFQEALSGIDMTVKDMQDFTRKDIVINYYIEKEFTSKATVSEADVRKFYDDNMEQYFRKPEVARASHILIGADDKASAEDRKKAKEKAEALLKRIKAGEEFAALAKSDSSCPSSSQGGDLGVFGRGQMVPAFENAAFALKAGEVSGVVETQFGYHIIKLVDKQAAETEQFEKVKDKITEFLKKEKVTQQLTALVEQLKKSAKIEKL